MKKVYSETTASSRRSRSEMQTDRVVEEVRAAREAYARQFGFDLRAVCRDLQRREKESGRQPVALPPRRSGRAPALPSTGQIDSQDPVRG
jgi:hypothetical protein